MSTLRSIASAALALAVCLGMTLFVGTPPAAAARTTFSNPSPIVLPAGVGKTSAAPSPITVSGMAGPITGVAVQLSGITYAVPDYLDILLVAPSGESVIVMSAACGTEPLVNTTFTVADGPPILQVTPGYMPDDSPPGCDQFTYLPTNFGQGHVWSYPNLPPPPHGEILADFNNENPNGTWRLYVEAGGLVAGQIGGGWSLTIETGPADAAVPATGTSGIASPYPMTRDVPAGDTLITDLDVVLEGVFHQNPDDLDMLLVGPTGKSMVLMSDACGSFDVNAYGWIFDDEAFDPIPDGGSGNDCGTTSWRPRDYEVGDVYPAPAPLGPHSSSLSGYDLTSPSGQWRLFVRDDTSSNVGFLVNRFVLDMETRPKAAISVQETQDISEGVAGNLTLLRPYAGATAAGSVLVSTLPVSATEGTDYTPLAQRVTFAAGQTTATVPIDALTDAAVEGDETYVVQLSSALGDALLSDGSSATTVNIIDQSGPGDTTPPQTTITKGPKARTHSRKATLRFTSEAGATFQCKLDSAPWYACTSPEKFTGLKVGKHQFKVRSIDRAGNLDKSPAVRRWKILR